MKGFNIIVALSKKNNGIGLNNTLPWHLKKDLKYFKSLTTSCVNDTDINGIVIMGRNTWNSIPDKFKPLSNRINIVVSNTLNNLNDYNNTYVCKSFDEALNFCDSYQNLQIWVIGGQRLYNEAINHNYCSKLFVTEIYNNFECDCFFPTINSEFVLSKVSNFEEESNTHFRYLEYTNSNYYGIINQWYNSVEEKYLETLQYILYKGSKRIDRTGVGTMSVFGLQFKYDLTDTFPILTTRRIFMRGIFEELMLYLRGQTDNNILVEKGINIWTGNTTREFLDKRGLNDYPVGDMGETYGCNFRNFGGDYVNCNTPVENGFDQLQYVIDLIKNDPSSRRIIINLWNPKTLHKAALPSCLCKYQFWVDSDNKKLNLQIYIRSSDYYLANNWNTCTGALFVHLLCNLEGIDLEPGELTVVTGDTHIYLSHIECVKENLRNTPRPFPKLLVNRKCKNIEDFEYSDLKLVGYYPCKTTLKPEMAV